MAFSGGGRFCQQVPGSGVFSWQAVSDNRIWGVTISVDRPQLNWNWSRGLLGYFLKDMGPGRGVGDIFLGIASWQERFGRGVGPGFYTAEASC